MFKKKFIQIADWYIRKNYSEDFIHRDLIKDEISLRIKNAVVEANKINSRTKETEIKALQLQHKIKEDGYLAEIDNYKKIVDETNLLRDKVETLYFKVVERIKAISTITAENKHEGVSIINSVSSSIGRLDRINNNILDLVEEIDNNKDEDLSTLRITNFS